MAQHYKDLIAWQKAGLVAPVYAERRDFREEKLTV